jgi:D-arabinose 1-dehydrogenase-like Zn-dependent alcohol dehydrogenase
VLGVASGATVYATSRDANKRDNAIVLGAAGAFDSNEPWPVQADVVFENVGAATWNNSIKALKPGGRLVTCGGTAGSTVEISLPRLFFKQHEIIGSTMGSYAEFTEVLGLVAKGVPVPIDETLDGLDAFPKALERLQAGDQSGKIVIRHH